MSHPALDTPATDSRGLAAALEPALRQACEDRLSDIRWFKADWQRGGAATGTASWRLDDDREVPAIVKLPVAGRELTWTRRMNGEPSAISSQRSAVAAHRSANGTQDSASSAQDSLPADPIVPRLYASGEELSGYDLAWLVLEKLPFGPLGLHWHDGHVPRLAQAAARFALAAGRFPIEGESRHEPWAGELEDALRSLKINTMAEEARWIRAIKALRQGLAPLVARWESAGVEWIHGDLHLANAMSRTGSDSGAVCLIDLAEVRPGHWIEDAVYLERQLWSRPERLQPARPVKAIAAARRELGLPVEPDYPALAMIRRALLAATAPRFIKSEGHPKHLAACLQWLETALAELKQA